MRCAIPTCDSDHSSSSGISFHRLPEVKLLYAAWEKAFSKAGWRLAPGSIICSKHFLQKDLFFTASGRHVRSGALPIVDENGPDEDSIPECNVKVCRICFSMDCKLYSMTTSDTLSKAYEKLTGLSIVDEEHLPRYLCTRCSRRLVTTERLRSWSLRAHVMLLDVFRRRGAVTRESIQSMIRTIDAANSSLSRNHKDSDSHNRQVESVYTLTDARDGTSLDDTGIDENIDDTNTEIDYVIEPSVINGDDTSDDDVDEVKTDIGDLSVQDNSASNVDEDIDVVSDANYDVSHDDRDECSSNVDEDVVVDDGLENGVNEGNISDDEFVDEESNERLVYSARLYEDIVSSVLKNIPGGGEDYSRSEEDYSRSEEDYSRSEEDYSRNEEDYSRSEEDNSRNEEDCRRSEEAANNNHSFEFMGEDVLWNPVLRGARQEISETIRVTERKSTQGLKDRSSHHGGPSGDVFCQTVSDSHLLERLEAHDADGSLICDECGFKTKSKYTFRRHVLTHSLKGLYSCKICKQMLSQNQLKVQPNSHLRQAIHSCDVCHKIFINKYTLARHVKGHLGLKPFACHLCEKTFTVKPGLSNHMRVHSDEGPYACDGCGVRFSSKRILANHIRTHLTKGPCLTGSTEMPFANTFSCPVCNKLFGDKKYLGMHLRLQHSAEKYSCDVCNLVLSNKANFRRHLKIYSAEYFHSCHLCKELLNNRHSLILHLRSHFGEE